MNDDNIEVEDMEHYRGSGGSYGIKEISLDQFRLCCREGSKEMCKGGMTRKLVGNILVEVEVPNQREVFLNAVEIMSIILEPKIKEEHFPDLRKEMDAIEKELKDESDSIEVKNSKVDQIKDPHIDKIATMNKNIDMHQLKMVSISRKKMRVLSQLLKELNYFDEEVGVGGLMG